MILYKHETAGFSNETAAHIMQGYHTFIAIVTAAIVMDRAEKIFAQNANRFG